MDSEIDGKQLVVYYEDGTSRVSRKDGLCTSDNVLQITLDNKVIIPRNRIVRIEVV